MSVRLATVLATPPALEIAPIFGRAVGVIWRSGPTWDGL